MIKIFILTEHIPFPLNAGGNISQFAILEDLQFKVEITLCLTVFNIGDSMAVENLRNLLPAVSFEIIDCRPPQARFKTLIQRVKKKLRPVTKIVLDYIVQYKQSINKQSYDEFDVIYTTNPYHNKSFHFLNKLISILKKKDYDIYQIEFYGFIDLVNIFPVNKPKVFIHHEIKFQRLITSAQRSNKLKEYKDYIIEINKSFEVAQLLKYDKIITFSCHDKFILSKEVQLNKIESIPFPILQSAFNNHHIEKFDKLIFVGPESHLPNWEGLKWFLDNCFESIFIVHKLPLYIVGEWSESTKKLFSIKDKIIFTGFVQNLVTFSINSINISPINIGSGIRTKILYSMAGNCPVVSTSIGAEGLKVNHDEHILIADTVSEFIQAVNKLITNLDFARIITRNAYEYVWDNFRQEKIVEYRTSIYKRLSNKI
jgi:glycosyltransferase involved in cell wall biosynthesis